MKHGKWAAMVVIIGGLLIPTPVWEHPHPVRLIAALLIVGCVWGFVVGRLRS